MVGDLTDGDHSIPGSEVSNMVDLSVDRLQAGKELFPGLADLVAALKDVAARPNEEDVGAARKQAHYFFCVEQPVCFEALLVQLLVCGDNIIRQSLRVLGVCTDGPAA